MTTLVTGASGTVSSTLVGALPASADLRLLVRDPQKAPAHPNAEVVVGDLHDPSSLTAAFKGVDTVWSLTPMGPDAPHASMNLVWAARQAGVRQIVRMSAVGAAHDAPTRNGRLHALSDAEIMASGLAWTIIRPMYFMQNLFGSLAGSTLYGFLGDGRVGMVDVRDIADVAAMVLTAPEAHAGKVYTVTGPESLSLGQAAASLEPIVGEPVRYQVLPNEAAFDVMVKAGLKEWDARVTLEYGAAYARGWGDFTTPDFTSITGRPGRSFAEFATDHLAHLRGAA